MSYIIALVLFLQGLTPTIVATNKGEDLLITYQAGAKMACTVFEMQTPENYAPRHCWLVEEDSTNYIDDWHLIPPYDKDWKVYAEVAYQGPDDKPVFLKSNVLSLHR